jgi:hypothetical protein
MGLTQCLMPVILATQETVMIVVRASLGKKLVRFLLDQ